MKTDLARLAGLPLGLDGTDLYFGPGVAPVKPTIRRAGNMAAVLYNPSTVPFERVLYYMYRGVCQAADAELIRRHGLRYDITVIPPAVIGSEYVKTAGHYHAPIPGRNKSYPEVYEVLVGEAHYLLQYLNPDAGIVEEAVLVSAGAGDKVLIPPNYGHVTINPSTEVLVMANWVANRSQSLYDPIVQHKGAVYYELQGPDGPTVIPNSHYAHVPPLLQRLPQQYHKLGLVKEIPLYQAFLINPELFRYLIQPELYQL